MQHDLFEWASVLIEYGLLLMFVALMLVAILFVVSTDRKPRALSSPDVKTLERLGVLRLSGVTWGTEDVVLASYVAQSRSRRRAALRITVPIMLVGSVGTVACVLGILAGIEATLLASKDKLSASTWLARYALLSGMLVVVLAMFMAIVLAVRRWGLRYIYRCAECSAVEFLIDAVDVTQKIALTDAIHLADVRRSSAWSIINAAAAVENLYTQRLAYLFPADQKRQLVRRGTLHSAEIRELVDRVLAGERADSETVAITLVSHLDRIASGHFTPMEDHADHVLPVRNQPAGKLVLLAGASALATGVVYPLIAERILGSSGAIWITTVAGVVGLVCVVIGILGRFGLDVLSTASHLLPTPDKADGPGADKPGEVAQ